MTITHELSTFNSMSFELIAVEDAPEEIPELVYETLYSKLDVPKEPRERWYDKAQSGRFLVARTKGDDADGTLLGCCRLMLVSEENPDAVQIRQVVVTAASQGLGIGRKLMLEAERLAKAEGAKEIFLWSRYPAYRFYENLDYEYTSEPWISEVTTIEHRTMVKLL